MQQSTSKNKTYYYKETSDIRGQRGVISENRERNANNIYIERERQKQGNFSECTIENPQQLNLAYVCIFMYNSNQIHYHGNRVVRGKKMESSYRILNQPVNTQKGKMGQKSKERIEAYHKI